MIFKKALENYLINPHFLKQIIKFCIVGGTAAIINFLVLLIFTELLGFWYLISAIFGFIVSATFNFLANKFWTFQHPAKGRQAFNQLFKFLVVTVSNLIISVLILYSLTEFVKFDYRISWVFAAGLGAFWNFSFNRFWTFKHHPDL